MQHHSQEWLTIHTSPNVNKIVMNIISISHYRQHLMSLIVTLTWPMKQTQISSYLFFYGKSERKMCLLFLPLIQFFLFSFYRFVAFLISLFLPPAFPTHRPFYFTMMQSLSCSHSSNILLFPCVGTLQAQQRWRGYTLASRYNQQFYWDLLLRNRNTHHSSLFLSTSVTHHSLMNL